MVPELFYQNVRESRYIETMGTTLPIFTWYAKNFRHFTT